ncbi:Adenylate/guanylate cyclase catalytic domain protein [Dirofilaria immitis]|nr:Adenylate/guanylate cyclase catalytic domain protein [Dirofilaria immitis]
MDLLQTAVPSHLVHTARQQFTKSPPTIYTEHYKQTSVVYCRLVGLEDILSCCSAQDSALLLNEFNTRIDQITKKCGCIRLQSDGILVISGIPVARDDHLKNAIAFACDLQTLIRSFCDATIVDLQLRCGIECGSVSCGIFGLTKWHYDAIGYPIEEAINIERIAPGSGIYIAEAAKRQVECNFRFEKCGQLWRVANENYYGDSNLSSSILFPNLKRFSLVTVPQAINRLLQTISSANDTLLKNSAAMGGRRKINYFRRMDKLALMNGKKSTDKDNNGRSVMNNYFLYFRNQQMEKAYQVQFDQWFVPALAISIFFLVIYGIYHVLVLPRQISTLIMIIISLAIIFMILLTLYANFFQNFCQFITRTAIGHTIIILLIISLLFICGIVNAFSCPQHSNLTPLDECGIVHFSQLNCAFWMLATSVFIRFPSLVLLGTLLIAFSVYSCHIFITHPMLYVNYAQFITAYNVEWELLGGLLVLSLLIFLHFRRNERILRLEFMSKLKELEETSNAERIELANQQMLQNALPMHIAQSFPTKSDLYHHICHSVGIAHINILSDDNDGEAAVRNLKNLICIFDQIVMQHRGIEKIRGCQKNYIVAVGVIPEFCKNVHDTPSTIGDLLAELTQFALDISAFAADHGISLNIGIDYGSVLSTVVNSQKPTYELVGMPCLGARTLMQHANCYGIMVSEEIYLALRPRNFNFDSRPIKISKTLNAYVFEDNYPDTSYQADETDINSSSLPLEQNSTSQNPLQMFASMNSSFSSEVYSIDIGVETDSEIEWITPEMLLYEKSAQLNAQPSTSSMQLPTNANHNYFYPQAYMSSDSQCESMTPERSRRRRFYSGRTPSWLNRSITSNTSRAFDGIDGNDKLAAAASRVDRMLAELTAIADFDPTPEDHPFPTALSASTKSLRRDISSACHTEYDNAESESNWSDSEMLDGRLERLHKTLKDCSRTSIPERRKNRLWSQSDNGNDADIDSICSSTGASSFFNNLRWSSVHSIGYENEYEFASKEDLKELARSQMEALSRDIRMNFGDYQLTTFSDDDS